MINIDHLKMIVCSSLIVSYVLLIKRNYLLDSIPRTDANVHSLKQTASSVATETSRLQSQHPEALMHVDILKIHQIAEDALLEASITNHTCQSTWPNHSDHCLHKQTSIKMASFRILTTLHHYVWLT